MSVRCCGFYRHPCHRPPDRIVLAADGLPRAVCEFHALERSLELPSAELVPDGMPRDLLVAWRQRERREQTRLRKEIAALQALLDASETRAAAIEDTLREGRHDG
jgi:hypothetical protein